MCLGYCFVAGGVSLWHVVVRCYVLCFAMCLACWLLCSFCLFWGIVMCDCSVAVIVDLCCLFVSGAKWPCKAFGLWCFWSLELFVSGAFCLWSCSSLVLFVSGAVGKWCWLVSGAAWSVELVGLWSWLVSGALCLRCLFKLVLGGCVGLAQCSV